MSREQLVALAELILASAHIPRGVRAVVVVTDASGERCGVHGNKDPVDVERLLRSALEGAEKINHEERQP
jgi:hypothetical protein